MSAHASSRMRADAAMWPLGVVLAAGALSLASTATAQTASKPDTPYGPMTGIWSGEYRYPEGTGQEPVKFTLILIQEGEVLAGFFKEKNTFGDQSQPWLHATVEGRYATSDRTFKFTKTYDGTAGPSHDVDYQGRLAAKNGEVEEGTWTLEKKLSGTFTMRQVHENE